MGYAHATSLDLQRLRGEGPEPSEDAALLQNQFLTQQPTTRGFFFASPSVLSTKLLSSRSSFNDAVFLFTKFLAVA